MSHSRANESALSQSEISPSLSRIFIIQAGHPARPVWFLGILSRCWHWGHRISSILETSSSFETGFDMSGFNTQKLSTAMDKNAILKRNPPSKAPGMKKAPRATKTIEGQARHSGHSDMRNHQDMIGRKSVVIQQYSFCNRRGSL